MLRVLEQLSMPSRPDFIALAERITNIEMRLDDMDAKLDRSSSRAKAANGATNAKKRASAKKKRHDRPEHERGRDIVANPAETFAETARTLNRVLTQKAAIAQTPKEVVWTLNKAKLYRYTPVVPAEQRHAGAAVAGLCVDEPAVDHGSPAGP